MSLFWREKGVADEIALYAPTNLRFQHFIHKNSGAFSVSVVTTFNDHFFKGKIFHENFKIISKIKKDFSWKDVKEFPRVSQKKVSRILVERCKKGGYNMKSLTHNYYIIIIYICNKI